MANQQLPLLSLNHVSFVCRSVRASVKFYSDVLGFVLIRRPSSFDFEGAWLFNDGIGIHLLEVESTPTKTAVINPKDNHISFQCTDMALIIKKLENMGIKYVTAIVSEGGVEVNQLFFHDPDGYMIEICNCHVLPVLPIATCPIVPVPHINQVESECESESESSFFDKSNSQEAASLTLNNTLKDKSNSQEAASLTLNKTADETRSSNYTCGEEVEVLMMENLLIDMMGISF